MRNGTKIIRHYEGRRPAKNVGASARATHERRGCADGGQARAAAPSQGTLLALRKIFQARIPGTAADRGGRRRGTAAFVWQQSRPQRVPRVAFVWPRRGARTYAVAFVWPRRRARGTAADRGGRRRGTAAFVWQQSRPQRVPRVAFVWPRRGARIYSVAFVWPRLLDTGDCCLRLAAEPPVTSTPRGLRLAATGGREHTPRLSSSRGGARGTLRDAG